MEQPVLFNPDQLPIAMRIAKGDHNSTEEDPPGDLALSLGGLLVGDNSKKICRQGIRNAYHCDPQGTEKLAEEIGLNLRECGITKNMVFSQ